MEAMTEQEKLTSQWITSLAISVVCCAALFLVFAGYIIDLHEKTADNSVRLEILQERQHQLVMELDALRRPVPVMAFSPYQQQKQGGQQNVAPVVMENAPYSPEAQMTTTGGNENNRPQDQPTNQNSALQQIVPESAMQKTQTVKPPDALAVPPVNPINPKNMAPSKPSPKK